MKIFVAFLLFAFSSLFCKGQSVETYTVMHYNLLYYGVYTSFCTFSNNNVYHKDGYLATIIDYVRPDIFTVNELGRGPLGPQDPANLFRILDKCLNVGGEERYNAAPYTNTTNSTIVNGLFYDNTKFVFDRGEVIANVVRDINLYTLYLKDEEMLLGGDTIFLHAVVAHLKAGSSAGDQNTRTTEIQSVMSYINSTNLRGNVMFLADLNMQTSSEFAYQVLTFNVNNEIRFYDPISEPGNWNLNPSFAMHHTQSTRTSSGCFAGGGMDDRFDQILISAPLVSGTQGLQYVDGSYYALGQDGLRFNQSLNSPPNNSAPPEVIDALFNMSDHLPVVLELERVQLPSAVQDYFAFLPEMVFNNPAKSILNLSVTNATGIGNISIFSLSGQLIIKFAVSLNYSSNQFCIDIYGLSSGTYFVRLEGEEFVPITRKMVVIN